jgi:hypothetical protein
MGVGSATSIYPSCGCPVLWVVVDFRRPVTVTTTPVAPKAAAPVKTVAVKQATAKTPAITATTAKTAPNTTATTAPVTTTTPTVAPSATALQSQLAASANPTSTGDPVSQMLNFATVLSQLPS